MPGLELQVLQIGALVLLLLFIARHASEEILKLINVWRRFFASRLKPSRRRTPPDIGP